MVRTRLFWIGLGCVSAYLAGFASSALATPGPGDLDRSFGNAGIVSGDTYVTDAWASMRVGPEGEIFVLTPNATNCGPTELCKAVTLQLARYARDGARDPSFGAGAQLAVAQNQYEHSALAVAPDGKPVIAALDGQSVTVARFGRDGLPDPGFGFDGVADAALGGASGNPPVVAVQADGRVLVAYEASGGGNEAILTLARFLADGRLDPSFGHSGSAEITASLAKPVGLALREGGGFDVGISQCCRGEGGAALEVGLDRLLPDGSLDPSLGATGKRIVPRPTASYLEAIAAAPGGKTYLVANEERRGSVVVRLLPNGFLDPGFGKGGEVQLGPAVGAATNISQIAVDGSGRLVGAAGYYGGGSHLFRLLPTGLPDRTFGAGREATVPAAGLNVSSSGFGFQPGGRIVMIVESGPSSGHTYELARLVGGNSKVRCLGKRAMIVGTAARETIVGTNGRDVIAALGGADKVRGLAGNDLICGGRGQDSIFGGGGKDRVRQ